MDLQQIISDQSAVVAAAKASAAERCSEKNSSSWDEPGIYYLYRLQLANGAYYIGSTPDPVRRFADHLVGFLTGSTIGSSFTLKHKIIGARIMAVLQTRRLATKAERDYVLNLQARKVEAYGGSVYTYPSKPRAKKSTA
jgi:predicted GIY-YIG superfamily endonuclease